MTTTLCPKMGVMQWTCTKDECICHLKDSIKPTCKKCGRRTRTGCDGEGWIEGKDYPDGSSMTARPCPNDNPHYETH